MRRRKYSAVVGECLGFNVAVPVGRRKPWTRASEKGREFASWPRTKAAFLSVDFGRDGCKHPCYTFGLFHSDGRSSCGQRTDERKQWSESESDRILPAIQSYRRWVRGLGETCGRTREGRCRDGHCAYITFGGANRRQDWFKLDDSCAPCRLKSECHQENFSTSVPTASAHHGTVPHSTCRIGAALYIHTHCIGWRSQSKARLPPRARCE